MAKYVTLEGFDDVNAFFELLIENEPAMVTQALVAGAKPFESSLAQHTPAGREYSRLLKGPLFRFQVTDIVLLGSNRGGYAQIGFARPGGDVANWLEYGWNLGPGGAYGWAPPQPFMRPAFDLAEDAAFNAVAVGISGFLDTLPSA